MGTHKLVLDDDFEEDFSLIAIHCSEEPYKVAYILNQFARLKLRREKVDLAGICLSSFRQSRVQTQRCILLIYKTRTLLPV
ncbi:IPExxxVDY family protein [Flavobacteriaceae bacterium]|nr:IPExxxVDY family protein [Flavobacteriaceae bacterium]